MPTLTLGNTCADPRITKLTQFPLASIKRELLRLLLDLPTTYNTPRYAWLSVELARIAPLLVGSTDRLEQWAIDEWDLPPASSYGALALLALERLV